MGLILNVHRRLLSTSRHGPRMNLILRCNSKENGAAATNLQQFTHFDSVALDQLTELNKTKEQLLLVDVDANDKFLRYIEPVSFAEAAFNHQVIAYIPTDLNYYATVLIAPHRGNLNWQVYGIDMEDFPKETSLNLELFQGIKNKHLLWEGPNILEWIVTDKKAISSSPAVPENIRFHL